VSALERSPPATVLECCRNLNGSDAEPIDEAHREAAAVQMQGVRVGDRFRCMTQAPCTPNSVAE
jgi:hypothetical protein